MESSQANSRKASQNANVLLELIAGNENEGISYDEAKKIVPAGELWEEAEEVSSNYGKYLGISTGYAGVDNLLGSFLPGELLVIAGSPGKGKSAFASNIAFNCVQRNLPVLFVSLEMKTSLSLSRIQLMAENDEQRDNIKSLLAFQAMPVMNDKELGVIMAQAKQDGFALVIIDYLQFIPKRTDKVREETARIVRHLKECAQEYSISVILISSINRSIEKGEKPDLRNLAETSVIEFTADMVGFVHRDNDSEVVEFYVRKNRSRRLIFEEVKFKQDVFRLEELNEGHKASSRNDPFGLPGQKVG